MTTPIASQAARDRDAIARAVCLRHCGTDAPAGLAHDIAREIERAEARGFAQAVAALRRAAS